MAPAKKSHWKFSLLLCCLSSSTSRAFCAPPLTKRCAFCTQQEVSSLITEIEIGTWTAVFATSHIGMSAIRGDLIQQCGQAAQSLRLVNNPTWRLPDLWPGDAEGGQAIFPTQEIAGRQLYRIGYTLVSFATLGSAFVAYVDSLYQNPTLSNDNQVAFCISVLSWGISITSLLNPSPLSLVPVYEGGDNAPDKSGGVGTIQRNDSSKLNAYGMTRITRHPLILPVVPWGFATAISLGSQPRDWMLFGGLAVYAIAGCAAQDLRVSRQEGSVGTVFSPGENLQNFFQDTSFVPFQAVVDGRQSLSEVVQEIPWWAFLVGLAVGYQLQTLLLDWIAAQAG